MIKWIHKPSGACPVQAEGYFLGHYFYFRSRWSVARIEFAKTEECWKKDNLTASFDLYHTKDTFAAGWLSERFCTKLIYKGCLKFSWFILKRLVIK